MQNIINTFDMSNLHPILQLVILIVGTAIIAKIADWIFSVMIQRLVLRSKNNLDDEMVRVDVREQQGAKEIHK